MLALSAVRMGVSMPGTTTTQGLAPSAEMFGEDLWSDLYNCIRRVELESEVLKKVDHMWLGEKSCWWGSSKLYQDTQIAMKLKLQWHLPKTASLGWQRSSLALGVDEDEPSIQLTLTLALTWQPQLPLSFTFTLKKKMTMTIRAVGRIELVLAEWLNRYRGLRFRWWLTDLRACSTMTTIPSTKARAVQPCVQHFNHAPKKRSQIWNFRSAGAYAAGRCSKLWNQGRVSICLVFPSFPPSFFFCSTWGLNPGLSLRKNVACRWAIEPHRQEGWELLFPMAIAARKIEAIKEKLKELAVRESH